MSSTPAESHAAFAIPQGRDGAQDMLSIGQQCTAPACTLVDFLPFKCDHCADRFCQEHHRPESHGCAKWDARAADRRALECPLCSTLIAIPPGEDPNVRMGQHVDNECVVMTGKAAKKSTTPICSRARCEKRLWQPIECEKCHQQFCASHRYPTMHSCSSTSTPVTTPSSQPNLLANFSSQTSAKSVAAMAAIKRSLVSSSSSPVRSLPARAPALATSASASSAASGASTSSSAPNKVKAVFSSKDRRAIAERKSQLRAMEERQRRGLLSQAEEERLKALQESIREGKDSDCVVM